MKYALALILAGTLAAPLAAEEVPLNTVTGGEGDAKVDGGLLAGGIATSGMALVGLIAAIAVVATQAGDDTTSTP